MLKKETQFYFCLSILSVIILIWLIAPLFHPDAFKGVFQQTNPDSLLFARLLEQSLLKGRVLEADNYAAFPYETKTGFAPFYLWFLYNFVNFVFFLFPDFNIDPIYVAGILPILIPWFTIIFLTISIYKLTNNKALTLFSAFAMLPGYSTIMVSGFFNLDYDYLISFYIWVWIIFGAFYLKTQKHIYVYLGAIITALFISTWNGSPFFFFFAILYGLFLFFINPLESTDYLSYASITMLIGSIVSIIFVPGTDDTLRYFFEFNVARYSYIQPILIFIGAVFILLLKRFVNIKSSKTLCLYIISFIAIGFIIVFQESIFQATGIIFKKDPVHSSILELSPGIEYNNIFDKKLGKDLFKFSPLIIFALYSYFLCFNKNLKKEMKFLFHWLLFFSFIFVFYQIRYIRWSGTGYGFFIGIILYTFWNLLKREYEIKNFNVKRIIVFVPIMLVTIIINYSYSSHSEKFSNKDIEFFSWIRENTPVTSGYVDNKKPEYGILAYWDQGNKISYYTKRPVVVSNSLWGYKTMADIFSSNNEIEAYELCKKNKIKYIVVEPPRYIDNKILSFWQVFKDMPESPEYKLYYNEVVTLDKFYYFYFWLTNHLALTKLGDFGIGKHFRVVFANSNDGIIMSRYVMFERVKGTKLDFKLEPNTKVSISLEIKFGELTFIYKTNMISDEKGNCQFILPYSTGYKSGNIVTDDYYKLSFVKDGNKTLAKLVVSNDEVIKGFKIDLNKSLTLVE